MVLQALDKIREAEDNVKIMRQDAKEEVDAYEQKKAGDFKKKQEKSQEKITVLLHALEIQKKEHLQKEKDILLSEVKEQNLDFREKYGKNKEAIIDYVIERVKKIYGSQ